MHMMSGEERKRTLFLWGIAFSFIPLIPFSVGLLKFLEPMSEQKAIGVGAVAGGMADAYLVFGIILTVALPLAGIVLLVRSLSKAHRMRSALSLVCICWSALTVALAGLFAWGFFIYLPRMAGR